MQGGMLGDSFEVWCATWERETLGALFDEEDGQSIVDVLEVCPFGNPL